MTAAPTEISSIATALDDLSTRIGHLAEQFSAEGRGELAIELFEVERSLAAGQRRLARLLK